MRWFEHFTDALARIQSALELEVLRHRVWASFGRGRSATPNRGVLSRLDEAFLRRREQLRRGTAPAVPTSPPH